MQKQTNKAGLQRTSGDEVRTKDIIHAANVIHYAELRRQTMNH